MDLFCIGDELYDALERNSRSEFIVIDSDTLSLDSQTRLPHLYLTKVYPVSHLRGLIAGTGISQFITDWTHYAMNCVLATDMDHLNQFTPCTLQEIAGNYPLDSQLTTTIYHFGYSYYKNTHVGFAYRSTNNFESESLQYGLILKPQTNPGSIDEENIGDELIRIAIQQWEEDKRRPIQERIGIGGRINRYYLCQNNLTISEVHVFDDYQENYDAMFRNLDSGQS